MKTILLTGAAGFIGSHSLVEFIQSGYRCVVVDNLSNSHQNFLPRIKKITNIDVPFYKVDLRNEEDLNAIFEKHDFECVVHFAGLKSVNESISKPLEYYENNVYGTIVLLKVMKKFNVKLFIFSSSCTVYGRNSVVPIDESQKTGDCTNPYGSTKFMIEIILQDICFKNDFKVISLRYFNPIGAHPSGLIGENPSGIPNNLIPYVLKVAAKQLPFLNVFGNDYGTHDGTGVRDHIHVVDLSQAHVKALESFNKVQGFKALNIGTGKGYSVMEIVRGVEKSSGHEVSYRIASRRDGDLSCVYADPTHANEFLNWKAQFDIEKMCEDSWRYQTMNPNGYED